MRDEIVKKRFKAGSGSLPFRGNSSQTMFRVPIPPTNYSHSLFLYLFPLVNMVMVHESGHVQGSVRHEALL